MPSGGFSWITRKTKLKSLWKHVFLFSLSESIGDFYHVQHGCRALLSFGMRIISLPLVTWIWNPAGNRKNSFTHLLPCKHRLLLFHPGPPYFIFHPWISTKKRQIDSLRRGLFLSIFKGAHVLVLRTQAETSLTGTTKATGINQDVQIFHNLCRSLAWICAEKAPLVFEQSDADGSTGTQVRCFCPEAGQRWQSAGNCWS